MLIFKLKIVVKHQDTSAVTNLCNSKKHNIILSLKIQLDVSITINFSTARSPDSSQPNGEISQRLLNQNHFRVLEQIQTFLCNISNGRL